MPHCPCGNEVALRLSLALGCGAVSGATGLLGGLLPTIYLWITGLGPLRPAYLYMEYHRQRGSDEDRRRVSWIHSPVFVAGALFVAAFLAAFALFILIVVNLAARLQGQAMDGQVVVSEALARRAGLESARLVPLGGRQLKNVAGPVACYGVLREAAAATAAHPEATST